MTTVYSGSVTAHHHPRGWVFPVSGIAFAGAGLLIAGALLPWLSLYAGIDTMRGVDALNGRLLLGAGVLAAVLASAHLWHARPITRWALGAVGVASAGFAAWVLAQLLGSYSELQNDPFVVPALGAGAFVSLAGGCVVLATLFLPVGIRPGDGAASRDVPDGVAGFLVTGAVASLICAALIHLAVIGPHLSESALYAGFFVAAGVAQLGAALVISVRPERRLLAAIGLANIGILVVWALSRTTGLPIGPTPWVPEDVSLPDVIASIAEVAIAGFCLAAWRRSARPKGVEPTRSWVPRGGAIAVSAVAAVAAGFAIVAVQGGAG